MTASKLIVFCLSVLHLCACTSMHAAPIETLNSPAEVVEVGSRIIVEKTDGSVAEFIVSSIDSDSVAGQDHQISFSEITSLQVQQTDGPETAGLIIVAGLVGFALFGLGSAFNTLNLIAD